ncbi:MAG: peptidyl-prolyl cis-trans isomerase [Phycisphaerales bacterium]|nr:peptidyl-prolyl cis-trans isomerase [Phycisphaerales bacterium]
MRIRLTTSKGPITIELDPKSAPISSENFVAYVKAGSYDGTIFHRVIGHFMIQGGGFTADMKKKATNKAIKNEWKNGLKNTRGTVAMARLGGNPDSATNQFFINVVDNAFLDRPQPDGAAYAVFGKVVEGMETVDAIKGVRTTSKGGMDDVPVEAVVIEKAEVVE